MKHYIIYQIRNKLNNMIYVGQHQTDNLDDGYMGSGLRIQRAIEKYGIDNFEKTILFECSSEEEMNNKEAEIVNEDFIARDDVYNITLGGHGGWNYVHHNYNINSKRAKNNWNKMSDFDKQKFSEKIRCTKIGIHRSTETKEKISNTMKRVFSDPTKNPMYGKHHSDEIKHKISIAQCGKNNSQYGTMWIYNETLKISKKISKNSEIPKGWNKGRKIFK